MPTPYKHFKFWCQSVLPLVYDDSLSYYEVLAKVGQYINNLIDSDKEISDKVEDIRTDLDEVSEKVDSYSTAKYAEKVIRESIATMVMFGLTDTGYFVAYVPDSWDDISFRTTGLDIETELMPDYGHLVLIY